MIHTALAFGVLAAMSLAATRFDPSLHVWADRPASNFTESTPLGNGRIGAMVFGVPGHERVVLNESTMWSGSPQDGDLPDAHRVLPEIRRLLLNGENLKAQRLLQQNFICKGPGSGNGSAKEGPYGCYQVFANLLIDTAGATEVTDYRRDLDLDAAIATVHYRSAAGRFSREAFVSAPDQVFVYRYRAERGSSVTFDAKLTRPERATSTHEGEAYVLSGQLASGSAAAQGVRFQGRLGVRATGGTVKVDDEGIHVSGAQEAVLFFAAGTSMFDANFDVQVKQALAHAQSKPYQNLRSAHVADYRRFFRRVDLTVPEEPNGSLPTAQRLIRNGGGEADPGLPALYFNFGRYLLISSSRPESPLPANLQGLWAEELQTPWNGDFHLNINVQMNYWPAEICNLSDCHTPLLRFISRLTANGAKTAQAYYGARGWVAHVLANPWLFTSPGEGADWGSTCSGSGWLCEHLWDHYAFTGDRQYLASVYPVLRGAAEFYLDMLIEEPSHRWLVTAPSNSPENSFILNGSPVSTCMGPTIDSQIVRELFGNVIQASTLLGEDAELRKRLETAIGRLAPTRVGKHGQIMEWLDDYPEAEVTHRHVSPLYGLYPASQITQEGTPDLAEAARVTLARRGDASTGWSLAWKICLAARLGDGEHAWSLLRRLLGPVTLHGKGAHGGGSYPNLFDAHPPFQIDGNFGAAAGVAEMLLRSTEDSVTLLPALPKAWESKGEVRGLRARGGLTVSIAWEQGKITRYRVMGKGSKQVHVRFGRPMASK